MQQPAHLFWANTPIATNIVHAIVGGALDAEWERLQQRRAQDAQLRVAYDDMQRRNADPLAYFAPPAPPLPASWGAPPISLPIIYEPPKLPVVSASQMETFSLCQRKWGWRYLDGIDEPPNRAAECGKRVHAILEQWLKRGVPPNPEETLTIDNHTYYPGLIAIAGLHNLPTPGPHHDTEAGFVVPFITGAPAQWRGFVDSAYEVTEVQAQIGSTPVDEGLVTVTPEVLDHKTTTNLGYRKTPEDLKTDVQGLVYAHAVMHKTGAKRANLRWVYYKSTKPYRSEVSFVVLTLEHVLEHLTLWEELAKVAIHYKQSGKRALDMQMNPRACDRFGGCPHKNVRCKLTPGEVMVASMSAEMSLLEKVQAAKQQLNGGQAAPPVPIANTAPVFGQGQQLPAPWQVHPSDPMWLWNPQTNGLEQHTADGIARIWQSVQPPVQQVAPPPPPVQQPVQQMQAPPQYAMQAPQAYVQPAQPQPPAPPTQIVQSAPPGALNAAQAQAWMHPPQAPAQQPVQVVQAPAPQQPPALSPTERVAIVMAVKQGALDSQILAVYPNAAPHLDALRLEAQGPQRATGINAPEGAQHPPVAQPQVQPTLATDAFDAMSVEQLRDFAKAHNIDVKGLREKNLRAAVRKNAQNGTSGPAMPVQMQIHAPPAQMQQIVQPLAPPAQMQIVQSPAPPQMQQMQQIVQPPAPPIPAGYQLQPPAPPALSQATGNVYIRQTLDAINQIRGQLNEIEQRLHQVLGI